MTLVFMFSLFFIHIIACNLENDVTTKAVFRDFSLFLSILNGVGLLLVFTATKKLREFIANLIQFSRQKNEVASAKFITIYKNSFLSNRTIYYGFSFAIINSLAAYIFGVSYFEEGRYYLLASFYLQVFLIGFIAGLTINGLLVVLKLIRNFSIEDDIQLFYFYPDQCAGTLIIGHILFLFSIHFIIMGFLIYIFINNFPWTNAYGDNYLINLLILSWKIVPFLLSALIFFIPAQKINSILSEYKLYEDLRIRKRMNYISEVMLSVKTNEADTTVLDNLSNHYQKLKEIDETISQMNTWPYNFKYRAIFLSFFLPGIVGLILEFSKGLLSHLFGLNI